MPAFTASCVTENHPANLLSAMDSLRLSSDLCDVVLSVGSLQIPAHRVVLAAASPYFRAMFTSGLKETHESTVTLHNVDPAAAKALVSHSYTGQVEIDNGNYLALFEASHMLQFSDVLQHCCKWMSSHLDESHGLKWALFGRSHGFVDCEFQKTADCWAALSLKSFAERGADEFFSLPCDYLCHLLKMDQLRVKSEEEVRELAWMWIRHDEENRLHHADKLLACVRVHSTADERSHFNKESGSSIESGVKSDQTAEQRVGNLGVVLAVGGINQETCCCNYKPEIEFDELWGSPISSVEFYDPAFDQWKKLPSLNNPRSDPGVVSVGGNVYVLGGHKEALIGYKSEYGSCDVERYDCQLKRWVADVEPMRSPRLQNHFIAFEGFIYGLGSCSENSFACERYDPVKNRWEEIKQIPHEMKEGKAIRRAIVLDGSIHVVIGNDEVNFLKYDHVMDSWSETLTCQLFERYTGFSASEYEWLHSTVAMNRHMLVFKCDVQGGVFEKIIEYEVGRGVTTIRGKPKSGDGHYARATRIAAGKEKFYIVAGYEGGKKVSGCYKYDYFFPGRHFCWLDIRTREWKEGPNLQEARGRCGVAVVDRRDILG